MQGRQKPVREIRRLMQWREKPLQRGWQARALGSRTQTEKAAPHEPSTQPCRRRCADDHRRPSPVTGCGHKAAKRTRRLLSFQSRLALGEDGLGVGEVGGAEAGVNLHCLLGMRQRLGGPALAHQGLC